MSNHVSDADLRALADVLSGEGIAEAMTCTEADTCARFLAAYGERTGAESVIAAHLYGDQGDDDEHGHMWIDGTPDREAVADYVEELI